VRVAEHASTTAWMDRNLYSMQIWSAVTVAMRLVAVALVRFVQEEQLLLPLSFWSVVQEQDQEQDRDQEQQDQEQDHEQLQEQEQEQLLLLLSF
jgi:hypothetical protein